MFAGIGYEWIEDLGGRRSTASLNPANAAWRVQAFHAYADYALEPGFRAALERLEKLAIRASTAIMCAEALWTQCHRRLIADQLAARGWQVRHLIDERRAEPHVMPEFSINQDGIVTYPKMGF